MADERKDVVPEKIDPFVKAVGDVRQKKAKIFFGAVRGEGTERGRHNGVDLFVPVGTDIQIPAQKVILIGVVREANSGPGASMGNGLVFFVPDEKQPYFLQLCHLSSRTFGILRRHGYKAGSEISERPGGEAVAIAGSSRAGAMPHVHASAMTSIYFGGKVYEAANFLEMYKEGKMPRKNFAGVKPPSRFRNPMSLGGYLDPISLIDQGRLRFSNRPAPQLVAGMTEKEKRVLLALR